MDKLKHLEILLRVAECASFSRAAERLSVSKATVTVAIRTLERHLNVTLIRRDSRRQLLTDEGEQAVARARDILAGLEELESRFHVQGKALAGTIHVEVPVGFGQNILAPAMALFAQRHPAIRVTVALSNEPHNLTARAIDLAVRADRVESEQYVVRPLFVSEYVICGQPQVVAGLPAHPADLDPELCITTMPEESRHPMRWELAQSTQRVQIDPRAPMHFNNADAALTVVRASPLVTSVLDLYASRHLHSGALVRAYPDWQMRRKPGYLVMTRDAAQSPKVQAFCDFVKELIPAANRPDVDVEVVVQPQLLQPKPR